MPGFYQPKRPPRDPRPDLTNKTWQAGYASEVSERYERLRGSGDAETQRLLDEYFPAGFHTYPQVDQVHSLNRIEARLKLIAEGRIRPGPFTEEQRARDMAALFGPQL